MTDEEVQLIAQLSRDYFGLRQVPRWGLCGIHPQLNGWGLYYGLELYSWRGRFDFESFIDVCMALATWDDKLPIGPWKKWKGLGPDDNSYHDDINEEEAYREKAAREAEKAQLAAIGRDYRLDLSKKADDAAAPSAPQPRDKTP